MKFWKLTAVAALVAVPVLAQQAQPPAQAQDDSQKIVASINGEVVTKAKLDAMYARLGAQMRAQYDKTGGKMGFLDNYVKKRLMIQEALKSGFDKRPSVALEVEAAKESALFDLYIRDVVAAQYVTEDAIKKYYQDNAAQFATPEQVKVRHIVVGPQGRTKEEQRQKITGIFAELRPSLPPPGADANAQQYFLNLFSQAARKYSEDGVAEMGGDIGWVGREGLDKTFAETAFNLRKGVMSGIIETPFGFHLILAEDKRPASVQSYEQVRGDIREFLMNQFGADVMTEVARLTNDLRQNSKVAMYPENVK